MGKTTILYIAVFLAALVGGSVVAYLLFRTPDDHAGPVGPSPPSNRVGEEPSSEAPPVLLQLPAFRLTDQHGRAYTPDHLLGRAWVGTFIFTRCVATCPAQTARMASLQQAWQVAESWEDIRLVSITVDPGHDTPEVLRQYAERHNADHDHWRFLTGDAEQIMTLCREGFKLPVSAGPPITHSAKFVLVDPQGFLRGYYDSGSEVEIGNLKRDLAAVLEERVLIDPMGNATEDLLAPAWLEKRRQAQLQTASQLQAFHDFQFADRIVESGITFRNRIVDDAGRFWKPAHYDHGTGLAIADVDGDGRLDVYFVSQIGGNELWRNLGNGRFENITARAGVAVADRIGVTASFADIDNDGDADLYVTTVRGGNVLFENDGTGRFRDISRESGLDYNGHSSAAVFFDYNRDGRLDLFLVNVGLYTTNEIVEVRTDRFNPPTSHPARYYAANPDAFAAHMDPQRSERSLLFENQGGNRFVNVTEKVKLDHTGWSGDASPLDGNQDGWPDLYVLNMQGHDEYYENVQGQSFVKRSREVFPATPWGSMGIKVFDCNNDGRQDIYITDMHTDMADRLTPFREKEKINPQKFNPDLMGTDGNHVWGNALFRNEGGGRFKEVSDQMGTENYWPWGLSAGDLNGDGYTDVFVTSCMNYPFRYAINSLLLNDLGKKFIDSEFILGVEPRRNGRTAIPWFELDAAGTDRDHDVAKRWRKLGHRSSRLVVWGALGSRSSVLFDLDGDGDLDIITNDFNSEPMVLVSNLSQKKRPLRFVKVKLQGVKSNRDGLGAVVTVRAAGRSYVQTYDGKSGYLSQSSYPLYFGLGEAAAIEQIEVAWPSGAKQVVPGAEAPINTLVVVKEPTGP
jgi:cytochrome oxidase Cu insertion factor (SCO1/SenC/PrrC family)